MSKYRGTYSLDDWRMRVEMDSTDPKLLGEDENGDLWVPSRSRHAWWDRRFSAWRPTHWRYWLRSRRKLRLAMIERGNVDA